jgi:UDP-glucose 4-epimerase
MQNNRKKMNILITGGAGYIGFHLCQYLLVNKNIKIDIIDDLSNSSEILIKKLKKNKNFNQFFKINISNSLKLQEIISNNSYDAIIHLAAKIDARESMLKKKKYELNNYIYSKALFDISKKYKVKKIVFASSAAVYGNTSQPFVNEVSRCNPVNPYGYYKLLCEKYLKKSKGYNYVIFRLFNVYGLKKNNIKFFKKKKSVFFKILGIIKNKKFFYVNTTNNKTLDNSYERDFIYINDFCKIIELILSSKKTNYTINIGVGRKISILQMINYFENIIKKKIKIKFKKFSPGEPFTVIANNSKLMNMLSFKTFTNLKKGILNFYN